MRKPSHRNKTDNYSLGSMGRNARETGAWARLTSLSKNNTYKKHLSSTPSQTSKFATHDGLVDFDQARKTLRRSDSIQAATSLGILAIGMTSPINEGRGYGLLAAGALFAASLVEARETIKELPIAPSEDQLSRLNVACKPAMLIGANLISSASTDIQGTLGAGSTLLIGFTLATAGVAAPVHQLDLRRQLESAEGQQRFTQQHQAQKPEPN